MSDNPFENGEGEGDAFDDLLGDGGEGTSPLENETAEETEIIDDGLDLLGDDDDEVLGTYTEEDLLGKAFRPYVPVPVNTYVPLRILTVKVSDQNIMDWETGPKLVLEGDHMSTAYGDKPWPFTIFCPYEVKDRQGKVRKSPLPTLVKLFHPDFRPGKPITMGMVKQLVREHLVDKTVMLRVNRHKEGSPREEIVVDARGNAQLDENGEIVKEQVTPINDQVDGNDPIAVPDREINVDGVGTVTVTWEDVHHLLPPVNMNTVVTAADKNGEVVRIEYTPEMTWVKYVPEQPEPVTSESSGFDVFTPAKDDFSGEKSA